MSADRASGSSSTAPDSATITGSITTGVVSGSSLSARATASIVGRSPSIPILTASTPMSSATARTWARMIVGRDRVDGGDADRVLRGDRGDRGHAVDAAGRERLQVGLDAGAATRVDCRQSRGPCGSTTPSVPRPMRLRFSSTISGKSRSHQSGHPEAAPRPTPHEPPEFESREGCQPRVGREPGAGQRGGRLVTLGDRCSSGCSSAGACARRGSQATVRTPAPNR